MGQAAAASVDDDRWWRGLWWRLLVVAGAMAVLAYVAWTVNEYRQYRSCPTLRTQAGHEYWSGQWSWFPIPRAGCAVLD
jgi:hypothetical protein